MTYPVNEQNWQKRSYDSYGPHFRIETSNPELGMCGNVAYNLYGYADSGDISNIGMTGDGKVHVYGDQTITVAGGAKIDNCLLYTSPSPRDVNRSRMPSSA